MFPLNWNIPFIKKNGSRTTLGAITGDIAGIEEDVADLTESVDNAEENIASLTSELNYHKGARQKLFRMTTNTKLVAKVKKSAVVSWGQMVLRFVGTNNGKYYDSIAYAQFNADGSAASSSHIVNLADTDPTLAASVDSDYLIITIGNLTNYVILSLDYYDNGMFNSPNHEDWIFSQES